MIPPPPTGRPRGGAYQKEQENANLIVKYEMTGLSLSGYFFRAPNLFHDILLNLECTDTQIS